MFFFWRSSLRFCGSLWISSFPKRYSPVHPESCIPRTFRSVDLPEPDGPMIETKSPSAMSKVIPRRA